MNGDEWVRQGIDL